MSKITIMVTKNAKMTPPTAPPTIAPSGDDSSGVSGGVVGGAKDRVVGIEEVGRGAKYINKYINMFRCGKSFYKELLSQYSVQVGLNTIC